MGAQRLRRRREQRGAVAVEFGLLILPLMMIISGVVNFGFAFSQQLALDNSIRQAARSGVVETGANPATVAQTEFAASALGDKKVPTISFPLRSSCEGSALGDSFQVNGNVDFKYPLPWFFPDSVISSTVNLDSEAEFQCEYS